MPIKNNLPQAPDESALRMPDNVPERRKINRKQDTFYQVVMIINLLAWALLAASLVLLHYARPDFITGVQNYWGVEGRTIWSQSHVGHLLTLLQICLFITIITIVLRSRRNRRKSDRFGVNILILLVISIVSLVTLYMTI